MERSMVTVKTYPKVMVPRMTRGLPVLVMRGILEEDVDVKDRSDEEVAFNGVCCGSWAEIDCSLLNIYMMEISDVTVRLFQIPTVEEMRSMTGWKTNG
jgi:hypothetical protein